MNNRLVLLRAVKYLLGILALVILFVFIDFSVDVKPSSIHSSYRFSLGPIELDQPVWLRQDNLTILLIRRSKQVIVDLKKSNKNLQDIDSNSSRQPDYARNSLRSRDDQYFVAYGLGTDLGCSLTVDIGYMLRESCGIATYDYAGRAIKAQNQFLNLAIPDYNFSRNFSVLTINQ